MRSSGTGWGAELLAVFISGFLLATMLWLGVWFFGARQGQEAEVRAREAAVREKETALLNCVAAKDQCIQQKANLQAENGEINAKLKEALLGWGRCIRGRNSPETPEIAKPNAP